MFKKKNKLSKETIAFLEQNIPAVEDAIKILKEVGIESERDPRVRNNKEIQYNGSGFNIHIYGGKDTIDAKDPLYLTISFEHVVVYNAWYLKYVEGPWETLIKELAKRPTIAQNLQDKYNENKARAEIIDYEIRDIMQYLTLSRIKSLELKDYNMIIYYNYNCDDKRYVIEYQGEDVYVANSYHEIQTLTEGPWEAILMNYRKNEEAKAYAEKHKVQLEQVDKYMQILKNS
ncbi:MAG: hypothetical protein J5892_02390 [Bacilli bacterium]|nr:hypothetical protein [Bacilli bacterium]